MGVQHSKLCQAENLSSSLWGNYVAAEGQREDGADEGDTDGAAGGSCGKPEAYATHYSHQDKAASALSGSHNPPPKFISLSDLLYGI